MLLTEKPLANPVVVLREEFDDWAVLFNPDTAEGIGINPTGVLVWKHLNGTCSIARIADVVRDHFSGTPDGVIDEITAFIKDLVQKGFVGLTVED